MLHNSNVMKLSVTEGYLLLIPAFSSPIIKIARGRRWRGIGFVVLIII